MATTPKKLKVAPYVYDVVKVQAMPDAGACESSFQTILLSTTQTDDQQRDTLIHEALHTLFNQGLGDQLKELDKGLEETLCAFLAPRLLGLLRDNPGLVEFLKEVT